MVRRPEGVTDDAVVTAAPERLTAPPSRKSTGKRLRFEVFKRDGFTCQYCGAQPPAIVLVVDHIAPAAHGGETTFDNLVTACEPCNQGKADRPLGLVAPRPDADLLYLEAAQEVAELKRYQEVKARLDEERHQLMTMFQALWCDIGGLDWHPTDRIMLQLIVRYPPEIVQLAIEDVAYKAGTGYLGYGRKWVPYLFRVAATIASEHGEGD